MAVADGEEANIRYSEWLQCSQMIMVVFLGKLFDFLLLQNLLLLVTCVCVCVCVSGFILFHLLVSSGCTTSVTYVRSSDQQSFVVSISRDFCQVPSSLFLNLSYFSSKDENSSRPLTGEKTIWYNVCPQKDDIYWYRI